MIHCNVSLLSQRSDMEEKNSFSMKLLATKGLWIISDQNNLGGQLTLQVRGKIFDLVVKCPFNTTVFYYLQALFSGVSTTNKLHCC